MNDWLTLLLNYIHGEAFHLRLILLALWLSFSAITYSLAVLVWVECRLWRARSASHAKEHDHTELDRDDPDGDEQRSGKDTKKLRAELTRFASQLVDQAKASFASRLDAVQKNADAGLEEAKTRFDDLVTEIREMKKRLEEEESSLVEERAWFERMEPIVHPRTARDLMFAAGGFSTTLPDRWAPSLEKRWTLLRQNPAFRATLLGLWNAEPVQRIGAHHGKLLQLSFQQYRHVRLATGGVPPRLAYWYHLHRAAKRQFIGVHNFFARLTRMDEPGFETFGSSIRGMTYAEQEIGWALITDPSHGNVVLAGAQLEDYVAHAKRELLLSWVSHAYRLYQEIFEIPRWERRDLTLVVDELSEVRFDGDGNVDEDVRGAGRLLGYDLVDIPLYGEVSAEVTPYINVRAAQHRNISEWLGYSLRIGKPAVLRLQTLPWKRRQGQDVLDGGAEIIVGKDADA